MTDVTFTCCKCGKTKPVQTSGGTGYAGSEYHKVCYDCCAIEDKEYMLKEGKITLYLTGGIGHDKDGRKMVSATWFGETHVSNWPGILKFTVEHIRLGYHNFARYRYDVWFKGPDGFEWHGVQYGDNTQICHCKRTKTYIGLDKERLAAQSSAIGDYEDSFERPGSSFLWIGDYHHLNREEVQQLVNHLQSWLKTGSLVEQSEPCTK